MAIVCGLLLAGWPQAAFAAPAGPAERISVTSAGAQGDGISGWPSVSADGRYMAFESSATDLVPGDVNGTTDVFVHDRLLGTTVRPVTSLLATGFAADGLYGAAISADGRYLSFTSWAPDLVPGDTNNTSDVFLLDLQSGVLERINLTTGGAEATNGISWGSDISADGRFVTFTSRARNLLPGRDQNSSRGADAFVRDRLTGTTTLVSVALNGLNGFRPSYDRGISADGRYVAFTSSAPDLLPDGVEVSSLYVRDLQTGTTTREALTSTGAPAGAGLHTATMSRDGRYVTFETAANDVVPGDTNNAVDVFVRDRITGEVELVSIADAGTQADNDSWDPRVSDGGRCVVFVSDATTLVPGDTNGKADLFVRDRQSGTTTRLTVDHAGGGDADGDTDGESRNGGGGNTVALRPDGGEIAFPSEAANLIPADTNAAADVFVRDTGCS